MNWAPTTIFLGTILIGDNLKFCKGIESKGPAMRPKSYSLRIFSPTSSASSLADTRFLQSDEKRGPSYCNLKPKVKPSISSLEEEFSYNDK